jgi:regulator of protease activity HflC (stomatin/prohibitin superfamily)
MKKVPVVALAVGGGVVLVTLLAGLLFIKPYDVPEFVEIDSSESAFLIPLEGDTTNQAAFHSVKFLEEKKVGAKRIQVTHRWSPTGFLPREGHWIPTVRLIKVDRRPVTREWTRSPKSGSAPKDEAISAESKDSVGFSVGISCTAHVPEEMAATFLYSYPSKSLADMMDMEVRARIHQVIAEEAGNYDLFNLPAKKNDIIKAVRADVEPFFKKMGIEITTLAMLGGLTFDNPEIQKAIDDAAKAAQLKVTAEAKRSAQEVENKTLLLAAEGKAAAAKREAESKVEVELVKVEGEAKTRIKTAEAEAETLKKIADAKAYEAQKANEQPEVYIRLKQLEAETKRWERWDGRYPNYVTQVGNGTSTGLFLPPLPFSDTTKASVRTDDRK